MKKSKIIVDKYEDKYWFLNGKKHKEDGPAVVTQDGSKGWYLNDKLHRIDGPAIELFDGSKYWFLNGKEVNKEQIIDFNPDITEREYIEFVINM